MPTSSHTLALAGCNAEQARNLAEQIDAGSPSEIILTRAGFPYPVAVEIARQATAGTGDIPKLVAVGVPGELAKAVKSAIDA